MLRDIDIELKRKVKMKNALNENIIGEGVESEGNDNLLLQRCVCTQLLEDVK